LDYERIFKSAIERLHDEGRYRVFVDILRSKGSYPNARCFGGNGPKPITVWCSNDYLSMGQHPAVIAAMEQALHEVGAHAVTWADALHRAGSTPEPGNARPLRNRRD
jgi:5-aminolevulinate synthase